jgi:hypothetical protein
MLPLYIIYFLHLLSTNHKCTQPSIFPCYSNMLLRRRRWTEIPWGGVLGYVLPQLPFLWCYGVFRYFISLRVIIVLRDIIYIIIILHSWHLVICDYFWPYVWNSWSWFWYKNRVSQKWYQSRVNHRNASIVRKVISLILFSSICESIFSNISPLLLIYKT